MIDYAGRVSGPGYFQFGLADVRFGQYRGQKHVVVQFEDTVLPGSLRPEDNILYREVA
ncbi:MAG: hypothetical protein O3A47_11600 [Chloroflexi bacterium]|nr:hypothetical protein [Chloroflexota bacterium]